MVQQILYRLHSMCGSGDGAVVSYGVQFFSMCVSELLGADSCILICWGMRPATVSGPTVPGGDTLCLTAGDARRVNPWVV